MMKTSITIRGLRRWMFKTSGSTKNGKPLKTLIASCKFSLKSPPPNPLPIAWRGGTEAGTVVLKDGTSHQGLKRLDSTVEPKAVANFYILIVLLFLAFLALPAHAQDAATTPDVTADEVNAIARKMYCPVCENIPLDVCPTAACIQWRAQIQTELQAGRSEDQIIAGFVARYGERVVGTPQDPTLRTLSLLTPWLLALVVVSVATAFLLHWWRQRRTMTLITVNNPPVNIADDDYRARLERDLQAKR